MTKAQLEQELANVRAERDTLLEQLQRLQTDDEDASVLHTMRANAQPDGVVVSAPRAPARNAWPVLAVRFGTWRGA